MSSSNQGEEEEGRNDSSQEISVSQVLAPSAIYVGIIDIFQEWNFQKKLERFFKLYCKPIVQLAHSDPKGLSCIPPDPYQKFIDY